MRKSIPFYLTKGGLLSALLAAVFAPHAFAASAGKIDFAFGKVSATGTDGAMRTLTKGSEIFSGDAITTSDGRVQIRFSDGAYVALQPNTVFKVDQYAFNGKQDGTEKGSFSLVKGSLRTITGLIGHVNKQNYEVRTPTATIGIRGTAYTASQSDDGLIVTVGRGLVSVSNQGGNILIGTGQSVLVRTPTSSPVMTDQRAAAIQQSQTQQARQEDQQQQTQQQTTTDTVVASGDQRTSTGAPAAIVVPPVTPVPPVNPLPPGNYAIALGYGSNAGHGISVQDGVNTVFDSDQILTSFSSSSGNLDFSAGQIAESGSDSVISWGRWTGPVTGSAAGAATYSLNEGIAYVVGQPSTIASLGLGSNATVNYSMVGATSPVTTVGGVSSLGTFSGNMSVTFNAAPVMTMSSTISNPTAGVSYEFIMSNIALHFNSSTNATFTAITSGTVAPSTGATININGFFAGSTGERLGIAYNINDTNGRKTTGAAAFQAGLPP